MDIGEMIAGLLGAAVGSIIPGIIFLMIVRFLFKPRSRFIAVIFAVLGGIIAYLIYSIHNDFLLENAICAFVVFLIIAIFGKTTPKVNVKSVDSSPKPKGQ